MLSLAFSSYWIVLCLIIGLAYAYALYAIGSKPWSGKWNVSLFILRSLAVTLITVLFLEPFFSARTTKSEKAQVIFLWDNSQSIANSIPAEKVQEIWSDVKNMAENLEEEKPVDVQIIGLNAEALSAKDSAVQSLQLSALDPAIKQISAQFDNALIAEVILFSDGIFNRGVSPDYFAYPFTITTVGVGDTAEKKDVELKNLRYNKVAYQGNKFPLVAEVVQNGYQDENTAISVYQNGTLLQRKTLSFNQSNSVETVEFIVEANKKGLQSYSVSIASFENEFNQKNNEQKAYINVVEGKKKVLILAAAPHPDIKALAQAISQNENYELELVVEGLDEFEKDKYDLAILFHLPNMDNSFQAEIQNLNNSRTPFWFITGPGTDAVQLNGLNQSGVMQAWTETDKAGAHINENFNEFELVSEQKKQLQVLPPVDVPFADYQVNPRSSTLFFKQIGKVKTDKPIFVFYADQDTKQATLLMEGFWKWRLVEHLNTGDFEFFDEWVVKTVRFLTTANNRDQFKLYPVKEEFSDAEEVVFRVEQYNQVYDRIYGRPVRLQITNEFDSSFNYRFTPDRVQPDFELGSLPSGVYQYSASTEIAEKRHEVSGQFVVSDFAIEQQNLVADFELLRRVSNKNEGRFFYANQSEELFNYLEGKKYPQTISGKIERKALTENYWIYALILLILFFEWFIRRYKGSY